MTRGPGGASVRRLAAGGPASSGYPPRMRCPVCEGATLVKTKARSLWLIKVPSSEGLFNVIERLRRRSDALLMLVRVR